MQLSEVDRLERKVCVCPAEPHITCRFHQLLHFCVEVGDAALQVLQRCVEYPHLGHIVGNKPGECARNEHDKMEAGILFREDNSIPKFCEGMTEYAFEAIENDDLLRRGGPLFRNGYGNGCSVEQGLEERSDHPAHYCRVARQMCSLFAEGGWKEEIMCYGDRCVERLSALGARVSRHRVYTLKKEFAL